MEWVFTFLLTKVADAVAKMRSVVLARLERQEGENRESSVGNYYNIEGLCWFGLTFWPLISISDIIRVQQSWDSKQKGIAIKIFKENLSRYKRVLDQKAGLTAHELKMYRYSNSSGIRLQTFDLRYSPKPGEDGTQFVANLDSRGMLSVIVGLPWNSGKLTAEKVCVAFYLCLNMIDLFAKGCYPRKNRSVQVFPWVTQLPGDFGTSWDGQELSDMVFPRGSAWYNSYKPIETIKLKNINPEASAKKYTGEFLYSLGSMYHEGGLTKFDIKEWLSRADACNANKPESQLLYEKIAMIDQDSNIDRVGK